MCQKVVLGADAVCTSPQYILSLFLFWVTKKNLRVQQIQYMIREERNSKRKFLLSTKLIQGDMIIQLFRPISAGLSVDNVIIITSQTIIARLITVCTVIIGSYTGGHFTLIYHSSTSHLLTLSGATHPAHTHILFPALLISSLFLYL